MSKRVSKFEALVVNAIRRLQSPQGSTPSEIANYLQKEYDVSGPEIRRQILLTIKRGVNYGILEKSKRGYTTCDRSMPKKSDPHDLMDCFNCRQSAKRSRGMKRGHQRRKSMNQKRGSKRSSGSKQKSRMVNRRRINRSPRKQANKTDTSKSKQPPSQEETPYGRQPTNNTNTNTNTSTNPGTNPGTNSGRPNSKSPTNSTDKKRET